MKLVIQCAAIQDPFAGSLRGADGRPVMLVAQPDRAPSEGAVSYARPDDQSTDGRTWRERLVAYNEDGDNPNGLLPACELYSHGAYAALLASFGLRRLFILSAGWGLLRASFLTPAYDITFAA